MQNMIVDIVADDNDANIDFVFENVIQKAKFPLIQTNTKSSANLEKSTQICFYFRSNFKLHKKNRKI